SSISSSYKSSDDKSRDDTANDVAEKEATKQSDALRKDTLVNTVSASRTFSPSHDPLMPALEDTTEMQRTSIFGKAYDDDDLVTNNYSYAAKSVGVYADFINMGPSTIVSPIPITRIHSIHPKAQIIGDPKSAVQTRGKIKKSSEEHFMISNIQRKRRTNHKDFHNCLFACFLSQHKPTKISQALNDESWVKTMQEELLQFQIQKVWTLVDLPYGKKAICTK
ncbi:hypothetical protein Tco_0055888, partial [Tanacetum coccineum]